MVVDPKALRYILHTVDQPTHDADGLNNTADRPDSRLHIPQMCEPYLAMYAAQPSPRAVLTNVAQLRAQILHAFEATRGLRLEILKIG